MTLENRLIENYATNQYAYDSQNKRVWAGTLVSNTLTGQSASLYGIDGQKLGTYSLSVTSTQFTVTATSLSVYFAGKRVAIVARGGNTPFVQDRLGSNMSGAQYPVSLYPWGEDRGTPAPNDQIKFATYTRDSSTLLDYADQRYYSSQFGRFATPDPAGASAASPSDPVSWNRFAYTRGDPVNRNDPSGRDDCIELDDGSIDCGLIGTADAWSWGAFDGLGDNNGPSYGYACAFGFISGCSLGQIAGGGGGVIQTFAGNGQDITVPNYTNARGNSMEAAITNVLEDIENALNSNPACAKWLQGGAALINALVGVSNGSGGNYGYGDFYNGTNQNYTTAAFAGTRNPDGTWTGSTGTFTINADGAFYNSTASGGKLTVGGYAGGTIQAQALILIHELAHNLGIPGFLPDDGNPGAVNSNNQQVLKNCGALINSL